MEAKSISFQDSQILYALHSTYASNDLDKAFELLLAMSSACEGSIIKYEPGVKLLGAVNRKAVTCYLDSIIFAMFSRLDSFESMLYNTFEDDARNRLGLLLRLWVNLLRTGKLITTDIVQLLQESLAECGWEEAAQLHQQDASEAFTFITEKLELPLLTLKMDIYHTGREDLTDDHKFINERLLEVAVPFDPADPQQSVPLEDCLESYFNNRIEVKRYLERRSTSSPVPPYNSPEAMSAKGGALHVETVELVGDASSRIPPSSTSSIQESPVRQRATSIIQQRFIPDGSGPSSPPAYEADVKHAGGRLRSGSIRKEVMMPAWQFFSLIRTSVHSINRCLITDKTSFAAWYTKNTPKNDAQVAAHFSSKRPILGMCLKRYSFTDNGKAIRLSTKIDIPTEIGLPHFISDDSMDEGGPIYGNFKLSLQSVVCHRGTSVDSGHYIALVKGTTASLGAENGFTSNGVQDTNHWMRFDDLASERITLVDIHQALKDETPYLLFYQIVPIESVPERLDDRESLPLYAPSETHDSGIGGMSVTSSNFQGSADEMLAPVRPSLEITAPEECPRGRSPVQEERSQSVAFSGPADPGDLAVPDPESSQPSSKRGSMQGKNGIQSRSQSQAGERFSISLSRLTRGKSKEAIPTLGNPVEADEIAGNGLEVPAASDEKVKGFLRRERRREKSKSRLNKAPNTSGKGKGEKPDRECCVM